MTLRIPFLVEENDRDAISKSPIYEIVEHVWKSIIAIAPEKANGTLDQIKRHSVEFRLENTGKFVFSAQHGESGCAVKASVQGLEFVWVLSYAYFVFYQYSQRPENREKGRLCFSDYPATSDAAKLLHWIVDRESSAGFGKPWPSDCPRPQRLPEASVSHEISDISFASELFLCAMGWIFHHELAHISLGHRGFSVLSIVEEIDADKLATKTVLDGVTNRLIIEKRGLGIAIALLAIGCLELETRVVRNSGFPSSHPKTAKRLYDALNHDAIANAPTVLDFTLYMLKMHFDHLGIDLIETEYPDRISCLSAYCVALSKKE